MSPKLIITLYHAFTYFLYTDLSAYLQKLLQKDMEFKSESDDQGQSDYSDPYNNLNNLLESLHNDDDEDDYRYYTSAPAEDHQPNRGEGDDPLSSQLTPEMLAKLHTCHSDASCTLPRQYCMLSEEYDIGLCGCVEGYSLDFNTGLCMADTPTTATTVTTTLQNQGLLLYTVCKCV